MGNKITQSKQKPNSGVTGPGKGDKRRTDELYAYMWGTDRPLARKEQARRSKDGVLWERDIKDGTTE